MLPVDSHIAEPKWLEVVERYCSTFFDFILLRPKRFHVRYIRQPKKYFSPYSYAFLTLCIYATLTILSLKMSPQETNRVLPPEKVFLTDIDIEKATGIFSAIFIVLPAIIGMLFVGVATKIGGLRISWQRLLHAQCYMFTWDIPWLLLTIIFTMITSHLSSDYPALSEIFNFIYGISFVVMLIVTTYYSICASAVFNNIQLRIFSWVILKSILIFLGIGIIVILLVAFFSPKTRIVAAESEGQIWRKKMDLVEVIVHFNDGDGDLKTLTVWNSTECTGLTCQSTTTKAHVGDTITFRIYYHNTTNAVAKNVKIKLNLPQDFSNVLLISSSVWSDNTRSPVIGTVNVNLSSQGSLRLIPKSMQWHPNQSSNPMPLLYKQSGDEIVRDSGLYLGNIVGPGWDTQGYLVVSAKVEEPYKE